MEKIDFENLPKKVQDEKRFGLLATASALKSEVQVFINLESGEMYCTAELKKAVQTSIKELCTTILENV